MFRGTLFAQVIAIIGAIFVAKIYGEEAYGIFGVFVSIISIVSVISTLQLDKCIVISKDDTESTNWFNFLLVLIPILTFIISALLFAFSIYYFRKR